MGNKISIDSEPIEFGRITKLAHFHASPIQPQQQQSQSQQQSQQHNCYSNIKAWCFSPRETDVTDTMVSAVRFIQKNEQIFKSRNCYLILHIYHREQYRQKNNFEKFSSSTREDRVGENDGDGSLFRVAMSTGEQLTPRGLQHRFSTGDMNTFGFSTIDGRQQQDSNDKSSRFFDLKIEEQEEDALAYDLYLWHGKKSNASTQATAITRAYELERCLMDQHSLETIFFSGKPEPIGNFYSEDVPTVASLGGGGDDDDGGKNDKNAFMALYRNNHLVRFLSDIVENEWTDSGSGTGSNDSNDIDNDASSSAIRSLLQLPSIRDSNMAFPSNGDPAPEYQASPIASPLGSPRGSPRFRQRLVPNLNLGGGGQTSLSLTSNSSDRKRRSAAFHIPRINKLAQSSPRKRSSEGLFEIFSEPKKLVLTPRTISDDLSSRSTTDGSSSRFSINLSSIERPYDVSDPSPTPRKIQSRLNALMNRPMSGAELVVYYRRICSQVHDCVYVGGDVVARDKSLLQTNGITHIINAALVACDIYFPDSFEYLAFSLYDAGNQAILGSFFATIDFIEKARKSGGKVYVHCYEGVSRSSTLAISYIMWRTRQTYNTTLEDVKSKRPVCSPNAGFIVQLLQWEKMLREPQTYLFRAAPLNDRYAEHRQVVPKLCNSDVLDSRTSFMVYSPDMHTVFLWDGSETQDCLRRPLEEFAHLFIKYFTDDKALLVSLTEEEAKTHEDFQQALENVHIDTRYSIKTTHYDDLDYLALVTDNDGDDGNSIQSNGDAGNGSLSPLGSSRMADGLLSNRRNSNATAASVVDDDDDDDDDEYDDDVKPGELYIYDDGWDKIDSFNVDDLLPDYYFVLKPEDRSCVYVWIGSEVKMDQQAAEEFGRARAKDFMEHLEMEPTEEVHVIVQGSESPEFNEYFFDPSGGEEEEDDEDELSESGMDSDVIMEDDDDDDDDIETEQ